MFRIFTGIIKENSRYFIMLFIFLFFLLSSNVLYGTLFFEHVSDFTDLQITSNSYYLSSVNSEPFSKDIINEILDILADYNYISSMSLPPREIESEFFDQQLIYTNTYEYSSIYLADSDFGILTNNITLLNDNEYSFMPFKDREYINLYSTEYNNIYYFINKDELNLLLMDAYGIDEAFNEFLNHLYLINPSLDEVTHLKSELNKFGDFLNINIFLNPKYNSHISSTRTISYIYFLTIILTILGLILSQNLLLRKVKNSEFSYVGFHLLKSYDSIQKMWVLLIYTLYFFSSGFSVMLNYYLFDLRFNNLSFILSLTTNLIFLSYSLTYLFKNISNIWGREGSEFNE
ncbi:hypothetical protein [Fundicoccus culcitae]|uniref:MacB-like periplasmic core domain-containing protein n=1 Tax=Fundicoccus culcitae TaxID=2969821 RepID=A0ABY5P7W3_9LACT|nr:hypothetical protein [Fundicoccus culcitae]UUX34470.1 hypothetical protein NRE15_02130 [Fundicoccus culcitae]